MNNLSDIQAQIEKLKKQEQQIKAKDFARTVQDIQEKMQAFGITMKDLQGPRSGKRLARGKADSAAKTLNGAVKKSAGKKLAGTKVAAKYRNTDGQSWTGRGLMPRWLKALVADGRTKEEFLIN